MDSSVDEATVVEGASAGATTPDEAGSISVDDMPAWREPRVGRYVLVEPIGKGSFGSVWAAFDPELDRKVAVKIVYMRRPGEDGSTAGTSALGTTGDNLLSEAQLLAQLSHPNVVAIYDVGWLDPDHVAAAGARALYVVMEHLGGPTLGAWITDESPSWRAAVSTMVQAGRGLEAAHARGLIHLDFKPGNVMFGTEGRVRVLDFGLARVQRRGRPSESGTMPVAGTPSYMAPEQHLGEEPDARADQFAFGVTLWEALWGERPFTADGDESVATLRKLKLEGPPTPPRKGQVPAHVRAVVLQALAPKPEDRFESMTALLAALEADPRARRRRWLVGGALAAGVVALSFGAGTREDPCALPEDRFAGVWDGEVDAALDQAFERAAPDIAEALMGRVRAGLDDQIARWTEVRAQVCEAGQAAGGEPGEAMAEASLCLEAHLQRISALTRSLAAADREAVARSADSVAQLADPEDCLQARSGREPRELDEVTRAEILAVREQLAVAETELALARFDSAFANANEARPRAEELGDPGILAELHQTRGRTLMGLARYDEAGEAFLAALASAERSGDERLVIGIALDHSQSETKASRFTEAELIARIIEARLDSGRVDDPELAIQLDLASSQYLIRQHRYDDARARATQGLERQRELDPDEGTKIAAFHVALGTVEGETHGDLDAATEHYETALAIWTEAFGPGHPQVGAIYINLGAIDFRRADYHATQERLESAAEVFSRVYPPTHPRHAMIAQNLAAVHMTLGNYGEAIAPSERALKGYERTIGRDSSQYAITEGNLAAMLVNLGRCQEALELVDHVITVFEAEFEANDARLLNGYATRAACQWQLGQVEEARATTAHVEALMDTVDPQDPRTSVGFFVIGDARLRAGDPEAALAASNRITSMMDEGRLTEPEPVADCARLLGRTLRALGRLDEARERLTKILDTHLGGTGEDAHLASWRTRIELGHIEEAAGKRDAARAHYEAAWRLLDGYERSPIFGADVSLALAALELDSDPAKARVRARKAKQVLAEADPCPELLARAVAILDEDEGQAGEEP